MSDIRRQLERLAEAELQRLRRLLPPPLRERLNALTLFLEMEPGPVHLGDGLDPDILGLFEGPDLTEPADGAPPARMTLFLLNLWEEAGHDPRRFRAEVHNTLLHELGHYLGLGEADLDERDLG